MRPDMAGAPNVDPTIYGGETDNTMLVHRLRDDDRLTLSGHSVELNPESETAAILGATRLEGVISLHGQAVDAPGEGVKIVGTGDGGIAEAIEIEPEGSASWIVGIQWHPEFEFTDEEQNRLFAEFIDHARNARRRRIASRH
jgi:putative glutamine amidotransferase